MKKTTLGRTGLEVTHLGYGAMEVRGAKPGSGRDIPEERAGEVLNAVLDAGINFVDTAVDYGLSEERIGRHISSRRGEYFLSTKCGCNPPDKGGDGKTWHIWTRDQLFKNIKGSLERLKTDHVDVLQLHNPVVDDVRQGGLVEALKEIQSQGMTRFIGISTSVPHLPEFVEMGAFDTFQIPYSCLQPVHHEALGLAAEAGAGVIVRGGIGQGGPEAAVPDRVRGRDIWEKAGLAELAGEMSPTDLILRYTLTHPHCHTTIVGTQNPKHLQANVTAAEAGPLPEELYAEITRRVKEAIEA